MFVPLLISPYIIQNSRTLHFDLRKEHRKIIVSWTTIPELTNTVRLYGYNFRIGGSII